MRSAAAMRIFLYFSTMTSKCRNDIVAIYVSAAQRYGKGHFFGGPLVPDAEVECPAHLHSLSSPVRGRLVARGSGGGDYSRRSSNSFSAPTGRFSRSDLAARACSAEDLGVTSEKASPVGEEGELQQRLIAAGAKAIYLPGAIIHHFVPRECYTARMGVAPQFPAGRDGLDHDPSIDAKPPQESSVFRLDHKGSRDRRRSRSDIALQKFIDGEQKILARIRDAYLAGIVHGAWTEDGRSRPAPAT